MEKNKNSNDNYNDIIAYEKKKNEIKLALFSEALAFTKIDNAINTSLKDLLECIVDYIKKNPTAFDSGKGEIQDLITALNAKESSTDIKGGDIIGGGINLQDIADFIKSISGFIKDEKDFFLQIIKWIICGC